jgi:hypothetical protein
MPLALLISVSDPAGDANSAATSAKNGFFIAET